MRTYFVVNRFLAFNMANIRCSIEDSIARFEPVLEAARSQNIPVRGYVSCIAGCPYQGYVDPDKVREVTQILLDKGINNSRSNCKLFIYFVIQDVTKYH